MDLMDINKFYQWNKPYRYLLNIIEVRSRYAWSFPLKSKHSNKIAEILDNIITELKKISPNDQITLTTDSGSEFLNKDIKKILDKHNIEKHYTINSKLQLHPTITAMVEQFNRTLWMIIKKYTFVNNTLSFINELPNFISNYNNKVHSSTNQKPYDILYNNKVPEEKVGNIPDTIQLNIGDNVRTIIKNKKFEKKSFEPKYSTAIYKIVGINGFKYELMNVKTGKTIERKYLIRELLKIYLPNLIDKIDKKDDNYDELLTNNKKHNKLIRKQKTEEAFKGDHVKQITDEGQVILKDRIKPKNDKRITDDLIGKRISVYWPRYKKWYPGTIIRYNLTKKQYEVLYDEDKENGLDEIFETLKGPKKVKWKFIN
jgi:hypothetical protein